MRINADSRPRIVEVARRSDNVNVLLHRHIPAAAGSARVAGARKWMKSP
jgi:hypothetical protein